MSEFRVLTEETITSMSETKMLTFVSKNHDNIPYLRTLATHPGTPANVLHLLYCLGDETVKSYVIFHKNLSAETAEKYVQDSCKNGSMFHSLPKDVLLNIFQNMPTWDVAKKLAKIVETNYPEPLNHTNDGYQKFDIFILPYLLINFNTPAEYIQQKYETTNFSEYNVNNRKHPLQIISQHVNTPSKVLHNIAMETNTGSHQTHVNIHEAELLHNVVKNRNTSYFTLMNEKFLNKITTSTLAYDVLNRLPEYDEYDDDAKNVLVYGNVPHFVKKLLPLMPDHLLLNDAHLTYLALTFGYNNADR